MPVHTNEREKLKSVCFKIEPELLMRLDAFATTHGLLRSEVLRLAVERFLEQEEITPKAKVGKPFKLKR